MDAELDAALLAAGEDELRYHLPTQSLIFEHRGMSLTLHVTGTELRRWLHRLLLAESVDDVAPHDLSPLAEAIGLLHQQLVAWVDLGTEPSADLERLVAALVTPGCSPHRSTDAPAPARCHAREMNTPTEQHDVVLDLVWNVSALPAPPVRAPDADYSWNLDGDVVRDLVLHAS